jgi:hypothetical protein
MKNIVILILLFFSTNTAVFSQSHQENVNKMWGESKRVMALSSTGKKQFAYVYKNGNPYGKYAGVVYDSFYKTYTITFSRQDGSRANCTIKDNNFTEAWGFKYSGNTYLLSDY